ncbi:Zn-dependent hydrolase [Aureimonas altamirensis]|uniref:Zn-dependent hydrolase n=1 Tax=Aureimonas altamirensis TaxID=370622 RepID=UPI002552EC35|nr:Zn-dependent hydrolase [Aureimonas altamirensis]
MLETDGMRIDGATLVSRLRELGRVGRDEQSRLSRLAVSDADKAGRDLFVQWARAAGLDVEVDRVGNIFAILHVANGEPSAPVMMGSHIDTVTDAGILDGCYGVLAGLSVIEAIQASGVRPAVPVAVAAFTNEEGVRYAPDMMGSLVYAGRMDVDEALAARGTDGTVLGEELTRIGYAGSGMARFPTPRAYVELHIEQGPILEREGIAIGAVENLQGISWQRVTVEGVANHAGTTPMSMRRDAGQAAARVVTFLSDRFKHADASTVATVGCMEFHPNAINVVPGRATFTVDLRDPDAGRLTEEERVLRGYLDQLAAKEGVAITLERLARSEPVSFDPHIVQIIEASVHASGYSVRRMTSGAGHDAQMMALVCPTAMIFVPSRGGISHNPNEHTDDADLIKGATILLDVVTRLLDDP